MLTRIGFDLFEQSSSGSSAIGPAGGGNGGGDVAFVPLAMPIMFGPGAIVTLIGMTPLVQHAQLSLFSLASVSLAIAATMAVTRVCLNSDKRLMRRVRPTGIDAATRIVGLLVSAIGVGLIFHCVIEAPQTYGVIPTS